MMKEYCIKSVMNKYCSENKDTLLIRHELELGIYLDDKIALDRKLRIGILKPDYRIGNMTLLTYAIRELNVSAVEILLKHNADKYIGTQEELTAYSQALALKRRHVVPRLEERKRRICNLML